MSTQPVDSEALLDQARAGQRGALARLLSLVERGGDGARAVARATHPRGGSAYTVGITGAPGGGKSTLTNALAGVAHMATRELRADGRGRHTTVHRELLTLPSGVLLIDTPGLRAVGLVDAAAGLDRVFSDIEGIALDCRFSDCGHTVEPGCAVLAALERGDLSPRRVASWRKLAREASWMAARQDARLRAAKVAEWKRIAKARRHQAPR